MTYNEAIELVAKGSPVRRAAWPEKTALILYNGKIMKRSAIGAMEWYATPLADSVAEDWLIDASAQTT